MLGLTSAKLMGIMLVLIPVVVVPLIVIGRRVRSLSGARFPGSHRRHQRPGGRDMVNAIQTVQAFTLEGLQSERYAQAVEDSFVTAAIRRHLRVRASLTAIGITLVFAGYITISALAGRAPSARGHDDRRPTLSVLAVRRLRRQFRRCARTGDVGRDAARCAGAHGAPGRAAACAPRHQRSAAPPSSFRRESAARHAFRQRHVSLSVAARQRRGSPMFSLEVVPGEEPLPS